MIFAQDTSTWALTVLRSNENVRGLQVIVNHAKAVHVTHAGADVLRDCLERAHENGNSVTNSHIGSEPCQSLSAALRRPSPHRSDPGTG